ncbi:MAG: hypothetical protein Q8L27_03030 [archaeon]|nr:hypothetical protein [archaeon]
MTITPSPNPYNTNIQNYCRFISKCPISDPENSTCASNVAENYFPDKPATCFSKMLKLEEDEKIEKRKKRLSGLLRFLNLN